MTGSWRLLTAGVHSGRPADDIVEKMMTSFDLRELRTATSKLRSSGWATPGFSVPQEATVNYSRWLAEVVMAGLTSIQNTAPMTVQFWVSAVELHKVPGVGPFCDQLGPPAVSSRLGDVDAKLQQVLNRLDAAERLEQTVAELAGTVTNLKEQMGKQQVAVVSPPAQPVSYADKLRVRTQQEGRRERSASTKRGRKDSPDPGEGTSEMAKRQRRGGGSRESRWDQQERREKPASALSQSLAAIRRDSGEVKERGVSRNAEQTRGFTLVQRRRKQGAAQKGSSAVEAEGGLRAPFSIFLSGTSPNTTEKIVKDKLELCAAEEKEAVLDILKVEHIPLRKIPPGEPLRSRCWKVTVAADWAEHMMTSAAYPAAWGWRKWNRGPGPSRGQGVQMQAGREMETERQRVGEPVRGQEERVEAGTGMEKRQQDVVGAGRE